MLNVNWCRQVANDSWRSGLSRRLRGGLPRDKSLLALRHSRRSAHPLSIAIQAYPVPFQQSPENHNYLLCFEEELECGHRLPIIPLVHSITFEEGADSQATGAGQMNVLFLIPMVMIALWLIAQLRCVGRSTDNETKTGTIWPRLRGCQSEDEVRRIIYEEFVRWFDAPIAGPEERYATIASEVWQLWLLKIQQDNPRDIAATRRVVRRRRRVASD